MEEEIKLDKMGTGPYKQRFTNIKRNFVDIANRIAEVADEIPDAWKGQKATNYCTQWDGFEPNMTITYNIYAKTKHDYRCCIGEIERADKS